MYKKIKNFFTTNLYWKALSVLIATGLWFVVMNLNNPTEIKTFPLNINILNEDKLKENNISILNIDEIKNQRAEIKIRATRATLDELNKKNNRENIKLTLDISGFLSYNIGETPLEITTNLRPILPNLPYPNNNFEIVSFFPNSSTLYLDKIITIPKKIHPKIIGKTKEGYMPSDPELSSEYIQITGPKSIVDTIQVVYAEVNITDKTTSLKEAVSPVAYDKNGNKVDGISFNIEKVSIKIPIILQGIISINEPNLTGDLPPGYIVDSISYEPKKVEVIGLDNSNNITKINLPDISINQLKESTEYVYDITPILNKYNLSLKNSNDKNITVSINIKKATVKQLNIPTSKISILGYNDKFIIDMPENFTINIVDDENVLNNIDITNLKYNIDVTGLTEGSHNINVDVTFPDEIKLASKPTIDISIINNSNNMDNSNININNDIANINNHTTTHSNNQNDGYTTTTQEQTTTSVSENAQISEDKKIETTTNKN